MIGSAKVRKKVRRKESAARRPSPGKAKPPEAKLPKLRWKDGDWHADISLPAWRGFLSRLGPYNFSSSKRPSTGKARLLIFAADGERLEPSAEQQRAWQYAVENQNAIRDAILKSVMKDYWIFQKNNEGWLDDPFMAPLRAILPDRFREPEELRKHIGLATVYIHRAAKGGTTYVGYGFGCTWDEEHGLGVMTHKRRVLGTGDEQVAFMDIAYAEEQRLARKKKGFVVPAVLDPKEFNGAVIDDNLPVVKAMLAAGFSPEKAYLGPGTANAIDQAVIHNRTAILKLLLKHTKRPLKQRLMGTAVHNKFTGIKKILIAHGLKE